MSHLPVDSKITEEAAKWLVRLQEDASPRTHGAFSAWARQSPLHIREFLMVRAVWEDMDCLHHAPVDTTRLDGDPDDAPSNVIPFQRLAGPLATDDRLPTAMHPKPTTAQPSRYGGIFAAGLAAIATLLLASDAEIGGASRTKRVEYVTDIGERRTLGLESGTEVDMNTDSHLIVEPNPAAPRIRLVRGEAVFRFPSGSKDELRMPGSEATVSGENAEIAIREHLDRVTVMVIAGEIRLTDSNHARSTLDTHLRSWRVGAAHEATVWRTRGGAQIFVRAIPASVILQRISWRNGILIFRGESLAEVAAEFNRYNKIKIVVADESLSRARIGGSFKAYDADAFVEAVSSVLPVRAERISATPLGNEIVVLHPAHESAPKPGAAFGDTFAGYKPSI